jgi:hypothetical protein
MTDLDEKIDFVSRVTIKRSIPSTFEIPLLKNLIEMDEDTWKKFKSGYSPVSLVISAILCIISAGSIMSHLSRVIKFTYEDVKIERWCYVESVTRMWERTKRLYTQFFIISVVNPANKFSK